MVIAPNFIIPLAGALLAGLVYLPFQLRLGYVWDDWQLFINNPALRMPETALAALVQPILPGTTYFRPLPLATFAAEFLTVGVYPQLSHAINLLLHVLNTFLVGLIALRLSASRTEPEKSLHTAAAVLFYGLHPALIEPVAWVSGRFDLLVTCFMLCAIWSYLSFNGFLRNVLIAIFFLCAALSKEMAVTLPVLLFIFFLLKNQTLAPRINSWNELWKNPEKTTFVTLFIVGLIYLALRAHFIGELSHQDNSVAHKLDGPVHHLAFIGQTSLFYLKMALWPFSDINPQHPFDPTDMTDLQRIVGVVSALCVILITSLSFLGRRPYLILFGAFLVALIPVLNIVPLTIGGNIGHERFLAFPLAMLSLSISQLQRPSRASARMQRALPFIAILGLTCWLALSAVNIRVTVPLWTSDYTLCPGLTQSTPTQVSLSFPTQRLQLGTDNSKLQNSCCAMLRSIKMNLKPNMRYF